MITQAFYAHNMRRNVFGHIKTGRFTQLVDKTTTITKSLTCECRISHVYFYQWGFLFKAIFITSFSFMTNLIVIMLPEVSYGSGFGVKQVLFLVVIVNIHSSLAFEWEIVKTSKPAQALKSSYVVCISHTVKTSPDNTQSCCCFLHCIFGILRSSKMR